MSTSHHFTAPLKQQRPLDEVLDSIDEEFADTLEKLKEAT